MRTSRSTTSIIGFLAFAFLLYLAPAARAQYQSTTYTLHGGWNSIFLHGDASYTTIDTLLAARPEIVSVWRWNPNPSLIQFSSSSLIPTNGTPEWSVWTRGGTANALTTLTGQAAYLVECTGVASDTILLPIVQKVLPPRGTWVRNGANLLGFPARLSSGYPTLANYFATFPIAIATNFRIYRYAGGPLGASNPIQIFSTTAETLDRTQAYWFESAVVSDFYAPVEIAPSNLDGLIYGRNGSLISVRVRNRTAAAITITVAPGTSTAAPVGQDQITAAVPLTYRTFNTTTAAYEFNAVTAAFNVVVGPQSTLELFFGVDRAQITGAANTLYASLLRFTDGGNLMDVFLPVSARVTSLSGLWIGDATVSGVANQMLARFHSCVVTRTVGTVVTKVTSRAAPSGTNVLAPVLSPAGTAGTLTYQWFKTDPATNQDVAVATGGTAATLTLTAQEVLESEAFGGTTTAKSFPLRIILHVDDSGTARLLSQVYMGKLAAAPNNVGFCTLESALKQDEKAKSQRFTAAHLPPDTVLGSGTGSVALGQTLVRTLSLPYNAPTNPFVHTYHPDHDNRNARFDGPVAAGVESPDITRACTFAFTATPPAGTSSQGWGSSVIGGNYFETISGIRKAKLADGTTTNSVTVSGTFVLRRASEIGSITTN